MLLQERLQVRVLGEIIRVVDQAGVLSQIGANILMLVQVLVKIAHFTARDVFVTRLLGECDGRDTQGHGDCQHPSCYTSSHVNPSTLNTDEEFVSGGTLYFDSGSPFAGCWVKVRIVAIDEARWSAG